MPAGAQNCSCKKSGKPCIDCLPRRRGRCQNGSLHQLPHAVFVSTPSEISTPSYTHDTSVVAATASLEGSLAEGINIPQCHNRCEDGGESSPVGTAARADGSASLLDHTEPTLSLDMDVFETFTISSEEHIERDGDGSMSNILEPLPVYSPINEPTFAWGNVDGDTFSHSVTCCYAEVVHWKRNLFKVPSGKVGSSFVKELTRLIRAYADSSALESVALKAVMVMPHLLLQKSHRTSKTEDHITQLERCLKSWADGDIGHLLQEGHTIQKQLSSSLPSSSLQNAMAQRFATLMMGGNVKAALRMITNQEKGGVLPLKSAVSTDDKATKTVHDVLLEKHPPSKSPVSSAICDSNHSILDPHPVLFDQIDGPFI